jgi:predicted PolB exonuclease-like 3'-5' exonuclease
MENTNLPSEIIFLDIETVSAFPLLDMAPSKEQALWKIKEAQINSKVPDSQTSYARAGIYAEFGKIICICCGVLFQEENSTFLKINTFSSKKEKRLLEEFVCFINSHRKNNTLCAHNGKEFDFPFICRRLLVHGLDIPSALQIAGKKPWEVKHLDTLELWKFGDYKHYTSLDLLAHVFKLPSPKKMMNGGMVHEFFYEKKDLKSIRNYCENDILTLVCVYLHLSNQTQWIPKHIEVERMQ